MICKLDFYLVFMGDCTPDWPAVDTRVQSRFFCQAGI